MIFKDIRNIIILILICLISLLSFYFINKSKDLDQRYQESENLRILKLEEENNLRSELDDILEQYDNSKLEVGFLNEDLESKQNEVDNLKGDLNKRKKEIDNLKKEIRELLDVKNDLSKAKEKIIRLQEITKKYFNQLDSLQGMTEQLQDQNQSLKVENQQIKTQNLNLNEENLDLNARIDVGSTLEIFDVEIDKLKVSSHGQERKVIWAKNIQFLRNCFTVAANQIAKSEKKLVFIQYFDPSGKLLSPEYSFTINDSVIYYTTSKEFDYQNVDTELCIDWYRKDVLSSGRYKVVFYVENKIVGESSFNLN